MLRSFAVVLLGLCAACGTWSRSLPPATVGGLPWGDTPVDRELLSARGLVERGQPRRALDVVEGLANGPAAPVDALRLRQDLLRERGRRGLIWCEAEAAVQARPDDSVAHYLRGRVTLDRELKLRSFARAAELAPDTLWPWLGLAHTLRGDDPDWSLAIYEQLFRAADGHPLVAVALAATLREGRQLEEAARIYDLLRGDPRVPGTGDLGLAQCLIDLDRRAPAWAALIAALRQRPFDPVVQSLLRSWFQIGVTEDQTAQVLDTLREDPARLRGFAAGDGALVLADLLHRSLQPQAALVEVERLVADGRRPALSRLQRRLLLAVGEVGAFLELVRACVPIDVVGAETNRLRARWLRLLQGPWHDGEPLATPERAVELCDALLAVGWLVEVEQVAAVALRRWPAAAERLVARRDEARRELAFEAAVRRLLYSGYQQQDRASLRDVVARMRDLSRGILGRDVVGEPPLFSVPMVGEMLDPFSGPLAEHFDRYNRHFVLGARSGGTAEGMLFVRLSLADLPDSEALALPGRCYEVVVVDRDVRALAGVLGGDVAGVALLNHFLVDHDAVREWARSIADRRRIAAEDGGALVRDPLPAEPGLDPVDVAWRLAVQSPVADADLDAAVLDMVRHHERQHLVDAFHFLPIESNLLRGLGLLFSFGLSPSAIEAEMERRAELAALAVSPHTELVLAHIADFLGEPDVESPHHRGFGDLGRQLCFALQEVGVSADDALPSRWHRLPADVVRQAAQRLLARLP
jgi:hypothetical protein